MLPRRAIEQTEESIFHEHLVLLVAFVILAVGIVSFFFILHKLESAELSQLITLLICGYIQLGAGFLLFKANSYESFQKLRGVLALVPVLMDLKGNLEVTMASRMSRLANTSNQSHIIQNLCRIMAQNGFLITCQVNFVSIFAVLVTAFYLYTSHVALSFEHLAMLYAIAITTGLVTCLVIGSFVTFLVGMLSVSGYDPDDFATSLAASFGDFITILMMIFCTNGYYAISKNHSRFYLVVFALAVPIFAVSWYYTRRNPEIRQVFNQSWPPLLISTTISIIAGFIFESTNQKYKQTSLILLMLGGFVGNSVSIVTSLISTTFSLNECNKESVRWLLSCKKVFYDYESNTKVSNTCRSHVLHAVVPCLFIYLITMAIFKDEYFIVTWSFVGFYLLAGVILLICMIYLTCNVVHVIYKMNMDPSDNAIPVMTSLIDLFASLTLMIFFKILTALQDPNVYIGDDSSTSSSSSSPANIAQTPSPPSSSRPVKF